MKLILLAFFLLLTLAKCDDECKAPSFVHDRDYEIFELGDIKLQEGGRIPQAKLAYKTYGTLNKDKSNVIVYPTWYSGIHSDNEWLIGRGMALDPDHYFIIVPNMIGNGVSSSPSNTPPPYNGPRFPRVTLYDQVTLQHRLVTEKFGIKTVELVVGWSMGGQQTFQWGALYPDMVKRIAPFCGSARTSVHNFVFLEGPKAALINDPLFQEGWYTPNSVPQRGLRGFARVYAGWGFSQAFYREHLYEKLGYPSVEDFLVGFWEGYFLKKDPNNLLSMLWTWQNADISKNPVYNGDFKKALGAIKAKAIVLPGSTDLYFPPEDNEAEVKAMPNAEYLPIESIWGHWAGGPGTNPEDVQTLDKILKRLLKTSV